MLYSTCYLQSLSFVTLIKACWKQLLQKYEWLQSLPRAVCKKRAKLYVVLQLMGPFDSAKFGSHSWMSGTVRECPETFGITRTTDLIVWREICDPWKMICNERYSDKCCLMSRILLGSCHVRHLL
jgi:hypothetical protein